jgi:hypothetical protein
MNVLQETFNLKLITTAQEDLKAMMGEELTEV